jgi:RimJ/RimL family protein N-acetyltransferase
VPGWTSRPRPPRTAIEGRYCRVEPLDAARHAPGLEASDRLDPEGRNWTYLGRETLHGVEAYRAWAEQAAHGARTRCSTPASTRRSGDAVGIGAYLRIDPPNGAIEVGHLLFSPRMQGTRIATEAMYLMMQRVFDELGYRRYEWKCDALNAPSRHAAERLGFTFEGVFPPGDRGEGQESRLRVVLHPRFGVAAVEARVRALARARESSTGRPAARAARGVARRLIRFAALTAS